MNYLETTPDAHADYREEKKRRIADLAGVLPGARTPVVSALSDKATALRAIKMGAHGFVHKPFSDAQLLASLRELMK